MGALSNGETRRLRTATWDELIERYSPEKELRVGHGSGMIELIQHIRGHPEFADVLADGPQLGMIRLFKSHYSTRIITVGWETSGIYTVHDNFYSIKSAEHLALTLKDTIQHLTTVDYGVPMTDKRLENTYFHQYHPLVSWAEAHDQLARYMHIAESEYAKKCTQNLLDIFDLIHQITEQTIFQPSSYGSTLALNAPKQSIRIAIGSGDAQALGVYKSVEFTLDNSVAAILDFLAQVPIEN
jgi:hypothetical protein